MFYAVAKGKKTGIFTSWNECKDYVMGYTGSKYKKFETREECQKFINYHNSCNISSLNYTQSSNKISNQKQKTSSRIIQTKLYSYVSNDNSIETSSHCGLGIFKNNIENKLSNIQKHKTLLFNDNEYYTYESIINNTSNTNDNINSTKSVNNVFSDLVIHDILINDKPCKSHIIFTDGSLKRVSKTTNIVKLGFYFDRIDKYYYLNMDKNTTNNQCELLAIYLSLLQYKNMFNTRNNDATNNNNLTDINTVTIVTDSDYSINCLTKWYKSWKKNNWKNSKKETVKNKEVIELTLDIINKYKSLGITVNFIHQPSHKSIKDMHTFYTDYVASLENNDINIIEKIQLKNKSDFALGNYYVDYLVQN